MIILMLNMIMICNNEDSEKMRKIPTDDDNNYDMNDDDAIYGNDNKDNHDDK